MPTLGVLFLSNDCRFTGQNPDFGLGVADARRYEIPPLQRKVPGAWARNVVAGDPSCAEGYAKAARELVREGADAITCNCGFTVRYQQAIAEAVPVPVSTSSLLLLPTLLTNVPQSKKIAVLTADSTCLDDGILAALGVTDRARLVIEGLEGTPTYDWMWAEDAGIDVNDVLADTDEMIARVQAHENIAAILCECTIFPYVSSRIRKATGLPVYDAANNVALLMGGLK